MADVWNESHIIWKPFQTPFIPLYKALHGTFSKDTENSKVKVQLVYKTLWTFRPPNNKLPIQA